MGRQHFFTHGKAQGWCWQIGMHPLGERGKFPYQAAARPRRTL